MKRKFFGGLPIVFGLIAPMFLVVCDRMDLEDQSGNSDSQVIRVTRRDISSSVLATGIIKPMIGADVRVGSRISGVVRKLHAGIGDRVEKGDLLAELDAIELEAKYNLAVASLDMARANLKYARLDVERKRELYKNNFTSEDELLISENNFDVSRLSLTEAEANLDYAKIQLQYTKILAPISGVVSSVSTQEGETVAASFSTPTFVTIIDLERLEVWAYVDETDIGRIEEGQSAIFTVDTYPDTEFEGTVTAIYPKAEIQDNVVNYISVIRIGETQEKTLRPEMTTVVTILLEKHENVLTVPRQAVHRERGKKFVIVLENDQPERRWVTAGWSDDDYTEIIEGLEEDELVVLEAL